MYTWRHSSLNRTQKNPLAARNWFFICYPKLHILNKRTHLLMPIFFFHAFRFYTLIAQMQFPPSSRWKTYFKLQFYRVLNWIHLCMARDFSQVPLHSFFPLVWTKLIFITFFTSLNIFLQEGYFFTNLEKMIQEKFPDNLILIKLKN
jgi:hypothetical protein